MEILRKYRLSESLAEHDLLSNMEPFYATEIKMLAIFKTGSI